MYAIVAVCSRLLATPGEPVNEDHVADCMYTIGHDHETVERCEQFRRDESLLQMREAQSPNHMAKVSSVCVDMLLEEAETYGQQMTNRLADLFPIQDGHDTPSSSEQKTEL